jgi:hypothetical protein
MIFRELQKRYDRNSLATQRRASLYLNGKHDRYQAFKAMMKYGRKKPIRWWQSTYQHYKLWRDRND